MAKTIALLATLDTKGREVAYIRDLIEARGHRALVIDAGLIGEPATRADVSSSKVAEAGGSSLAALRARADREKSAPVMAAGATKIVRELVEAGKIHAILALGGTQGTTLATAVMRGLPYGFPKIMVSTMASGNVGPWVGTSDITMMFSVTDIMGLNPFMRRILANAAGAACGMAEVELDEKQSAAAGGDHHGRHHHARRHERRARAGGGRLRDHRLPCGRHRRTGDGSDDASRA